ncbi:ABC transporter permease [Tomitella gaofuii]|uniref:ABC transporter permease n=1 Tax=Tomitella gaofuii TaxID=2760083 RepID=UPI0015FE5365|nr:ABC transporter permease [Tomitella gaofuii]
MGVVAAERIKLTSTRSPWWCAALIVVLGLGIAVLMAVLSHNTEATQGSDAFVLSATSATGGVNGFGVMIVMIMAALTVTTEYRFGVIRTTFQAIPHRAQVIAVKAAVVSVVSAAIVAVTAFGAFFLAKGIAGSGPAIQMDLDAETWRVLYGVVLYAALAAVLAVAVGALLRQTAAAIALVVLWPLVIEQLFLLFGDVGKDIYVFLPFANINHFLSAHGSTTADFHWGPWGGLVYFVVFTAIVFAISVGVVNKRDA